MSFASFRHRYNPFSHYNFDRHLCSKISSRKVQPRDQWEPSWHLVEHNWSEKAVTGVVLSRLSFTCTCYKSALKVIHWMVNISWEMLRNPVSYKAIFTFSQTSESNCCKLAVCVWIPIMVFNWNIYQSENTIQRSRSLFSFQYKKLPKVFILRNNKKHFPKINNYKILYVFMRLNYAHCI